MEGTEELCGPPVVALKKLSSNGPDGTSNGHIFAPKLSLILFAEPSMLFPSIDGFFFTFDLLPMLIWLLRPNKKILSFPVT